MTTLSNNLPAENWQFVEITDLGFVARKCDRCNRRIRYAHELQHNDWPELIACGRCCAAAIADYDAATAEAEFISRANRRAAFPKLRRWRLSGKGNPLIVYRSCRITIFPRGSFIENGHLRQAYAFSLAFQGPFKEVGTIFAEDEYANELAAKLAAFDHLYWLFSDSEEHDDGG